MARHTIARRGPGGRRVAVPLVAVAVAVAAVAGLSSLDPGSLLARAPVVGDDCPSSQLPTTTIAVTVSPDIASTVERIAGPLQRTELPDGNCLKINFSAQPAEETVAGAAILPADRAPHLWIPDSSIWAMRTQKWKTEKVASFASSPVVIASSQQAIQELGWEKNPPSWADAMGGTLRPVAAKISLDAAGLSAVIAQWQSLGKGERAGQALAGTVLASLRSNAPSREDAIKDVESGNPDAPLIPMSEQAVAQVNSAIGGGDDARLVPVYPREGDRQILPALDFPALLVDSPSLTPERRTAVRAVAAALSSPAAATFVKAGGLRNATGTGGDAAPLPGASGVSTSDIKPAAPPTTEELNTVVSRVVALSAPSRVLTVIDVSGSMREDAPNGTDRITFSAQAAKAGGNFLPDVAQTGLWGFSRQLRGSENHIEYQEVAELGEQDGAQTHRQAMVQSMFDLKNRLGGNGTAIYDVAVKAVRKMTETYDPRAANTVVLYTDGENVDAGGPTLEQAIAQLKALHNPQRPVKLLAISVGGDADLSKLKQLSEATGGAAYPLKDPAVMPQVVFQMLNRRSSAG